MCSSRGARHTDCISRVCRFVLPGHHREIRNHCTGGDGMHRHGSSAADDETAGCPAESAAYGTVCFVIRDLQVQFSNNAAVPAILDDDILGGGLVPASIRKLDDPPSIRG